MSIFVNKEQSQFQLNTQNTSYIMMAERGYLIHLYWGKRLDDRDHTYMAGLNLLGAYTDVTEDTQSGFCLADVMLEYPASGRTDTRTYAVEILNSDGSNIVDPKFVKYEIINGKPEIDGLPSSFGENVQTLVITLLDKVSNIEIKLFYSVFEELDVITRHAEITNKSENAVNIKRALSMCVDFDNMDFDVITNHGAWGRERFIERSPLRHNCVSMSSRQGFTSHFHNPFLILTDKSCTENSGDAYGALLAYSGSFIAQADVSERDLTRMQLGINPEKFNWKLRAGERFCTPEAMLTYSSQGLNKMSQNFHTMLRENMCKSKFKNQRRPILLNSWEACYFNFDDKKLVDIGTKAANLGVELFVIDDGWFGERNSDKTSLGDWYVNTDKLKGGLENVYSQLKAAGIKLGIWFEPEMVSPKSHLYEAHPDWCMHAANRPRTTNRNQLLLDLSREDVCEHVYESVAKLLRTGMISYVKWDFNRFMSEVGSALADADTQPEIPHRYILGIYSVLKRITTDFPDVLFEACSAGGGRFDAAILQYMPQVWASDDSDAGMRLKIQYGTSLVYPLSSISAHISAVPNHQTHRDTPFSTRAAVAYTGSFGYELNPNELTDEDIDNFKKSLEFYKQNGDLFVTGDYYRIVSPFDEGSSAWCYVSKDKSTAYAAYVNADPHPHRPSVRIKLCGLDDSAEYKDEFSGNIYSGRQLMNYGLKVYADRERESNTCILRRI